MNYHTATNDNDLKEIQDKFHPKQSALLKCIKVPLEAI